MNHHVLQNEHGEYLIAYLLKLAAFEESGSAPYTDLTHVWIDQRSEYIQIYVIIVVILTELVFLLGLPFIIFFNFRHEIYQIMLDPTDRLITVGGYEETHPKFFDGGGSKSNRPPAYFSRQLEMYDTFEVTDPPIISDWFVTMMKAADAVTQGYAMAGMNADTAENYTIDQGGMMLGLGGMVGAIMGEQAQFNAVMKSEEYGGFLKAYTDGGGEMGSAQVVEIVKQMKEKGMTNEAILMKVHNMGKEEMRIRGRPVRRKIRTNDKTDDATMKQRTEVKKTPLLRLPRAKKIKRKKRNRVQQVVQVKRKEVVKGQKKNKKTTVKRRRRKNK